jgi:two-component system, cell cycle sensor histidine kinase DivJ
VSFLTPLRTYVDALVHPTAQADALTAAHHRAFIAPRLIGSLLALASLPVYLAFRGAPSLLEIAVFGWLLAPIGLVYFLSRTARYETAHVLSALLLTGLVSAIAWRTGNISSFAAIWLVVVPLEAALSASRRVVAVAVAFALCAAGLLVFLSNANLLGLPSLAADSAPALIALGIVSAALYGTALALGTQALARTGFSLLSREEERYRLLARTMTDVITRHGKNGAVLTVSPVAEALFGVRAGELLGHGLFDRVHVADRPAYLTALADAASLGEQRLLEFRIRRDGDAVQFVWVEMRCQPLEQSDADEREIVAVLRDISERKTHDRAMEIARAEKEPRNAAKSRFLATMSHELRTPLSAIIGFSQILGDDSIMLDAARRKEYARLINDSGQHLLSVVNGMLDVSKMDTGHLEIAPEPLAPGPAIMSCCDLLALKAREAGVEIKTRVAPGLPELTADRRAVNQILINLVSNAIKFTPRDGRITVGAYCDGAKLIVTVEDTGVGIGEDDLWRVGEAFFRARASYDRRHDGTGLGLSIVKGLVHLHDGELDIASRLGNGTRVTVKLPLGSQERAADPVKLVTDRAQEFAVAANVRVKKSA